MLTPIDLTQGVQEDLQALRRADPDAFAAVMVFVEEAAVDEDLIAKCCKHDQDVQLNLSRVGVKGWVTAKRTIGNLFRIRIFDTPATVYRVIYGFDWQAGRIGLLAVVHKDTFNYEVTGNLADRIYADWYCATDGRCP